MTISEWPRHGVGTYEAGSLFEMKGQNLNYLPRNVVAIALPNYLDADVGRAVWPLDSVSLDGSRAYFRLLSQQTYGSAAEYKFLATPTDAPREFWDDFDDASSSRSFESSIMEDIEMR